MGTPGTDPNHKTHEHTRGGFTHETQKFECLCEKKGTKARPKRFPITRHTNKQDTY